MKTHIFSRAAILVLLMAAGCAGNQQDPRIDALRRDPAWPAIRTAAEREVADHEGDADWAHAASYTPREHSNGLWVVRASAEHPLKKYANPGIEITLRDDGKVIAYSANLPNRPQ